MDKEKLINKILTRGVEKIYPSKEELEKVLKSDKKIKLYCGYDATAPTLHIGHAITLRKLAQFQDLGHEVIFLLGDFTSMIGDPTDKTAVRKKMTREEVKKNMTNYQEQASKVINFEGENPVKVLYNSEWNDKLSFIDLIEMASNFTHGQMIQRDMFQERIKQDESIYLHEFLYPLTQAYDSVAMDVDLEVGGNDQMFNMLAGRTLIKKMKNKEKFVLTTKLLVDSCGKKMGKTEGNVVNLDEEPNQMFGQIMSWPDDLILPGFELLTDLEVKEVKNPREDKAKLAKEITKTFHNEDLARKAEKEFNQVFKDKEKPTDTPIFKAKPEKTKLTDILTESKLAPSKSEARRLIEQGGVKIDNKVIKDPNEEITPKDKTIIQVGKRKFVKVKIS